jgi:hypothetical protein
VRSQEQQATLGEAFDRANRFRFVVHRGSCVDEQDRDRQDRGLPESLPTLNRTRLIGFGRLADPLSSAKRLAMCNEHRVN